MLPNDEEGEDTARLAIGQERLAVTPLQMGMVAGAVANGGMAMAPRLMTRIVDRGGSVVQRGEPEELGQVISPTNAADSRTPKPPRRRIPPRRALPAPHGSGVPPSRLLSPGPPDLVSLAGTP